MQGPITRTLDSAAQVGIDAAAGRDDVVALGRHHAAERHVMHVVVGEGLPDIAGAVVVQLDRPGGARDRIGELRAGAHVVDA